MSNLQIVHRNYEHEETWLREWCDYDGDFDISLRAGAEMQLLSVSLIEVLDALREGDIIYAEREEHGSEFMLVGETYDGEELSLGGKLNSTLGVVEILKISKAR